MIITVTEDKTAIVSIGDTSYSNNAGTRWESLRGLLLEIKNDYDTLRRVHDSDLMPDARERKKLLQEIVE
jgi:hypothetical protein